MPWIRLLLLTNLIYSAIYPQNEKQKIKTKENKKKEQKSSRTQRKYTLTMLFCQQHKDMVSLQQPDSD
jgi:hypothetical protein